MTTVSDTTRKDGSDPRVRCTHLNHKLSFWVTVDRPSRKQYLQELPSGGRCLPLGHSLDLDRVLQQLTLLNDESQEAHLGHVEFALLSLYKKVVFKQPSQDQLNALNFLLCLIKIKMSSWWTNKDLFSSSQGTLLNNAWKTAGALVR